MTLGIAVARGNSFLNTYRNVAYAAIAATYIQLHTGDPGAAGTANIAVGSTTRNLATWNAAAAGSMAFNTLSAWTNGGTSETITHISIWDASTSGNFLQSGALSVGQAWVSTNTLTLTTLVASITPIAA
jgi:hypothetical protein